MCDHKFVGHNKVRELRRAAGETVRRERTVAGATHVKVGRPAKFDMDAPEPEAQLLALAEPKMQVPEAARFVVSRTPDGGLQLHWPDFDVRFTLTASERMILRQVA